MTQIFFSFKFQINKKKTENGAVQGTCAKLVDAQCSTTTTTSANTTISDNLGSEFSQLCFFAPQNN